MNNHSGTDYAATRVYKYSKVVVQTHDIPRHIKTKNFNQFLFSGLNLITNTFLELRNRYRSHRRFFSLRFRIKSTYLNSPLPMQSGRRCPRHFKGTNTHHSVQIGQNLSNGINV